MAFGGIWKTIDDIHITNIVVKKTSRKKGIGSLLLKKLIELSLLEKPLSITLEVNANNIPAIKLYEKYGFKKVGLRRKYYKNTDDAIIMTLYIK